MKEDKNTNWIELKRIYVKELGVYIKDNERGRQIFKHCINGAVKYIEGDRELYFNSDCIIAYEYD